MEEKRKIVQEKVYDKDGKLDYIKIPNYVKTEYFMSKEEIRFYKVLINVLTNIRNKYQRRLEIFPQVAINRLIKQNNSREQELEKDIFARSIDYVIYDRDNDKVFCCIELDGIEHKTDEKRIKRDKIIDKAFAGNIKLKRQDVLKSYDEKDIENLILN